MKASDELNAKKQPLKARDALELAATVNEIYVAKGKRVVHVNLKKDKPSDDELKKLLLGPTGNLRAPTLRKGKTLMVGFDAETYDKVFG